MAIVFIVSIGFRRLKMKSFEHIEHLRYEIEVLKSMVKEHDTGHIITAIQVLKARVEEMLDADKDILDSSYPDGDGYWLDK